MHGPLLVGFRPDRGNLPSGYYVIDRVAWRLHITADNFRTVSGACRIAHDICAELG